MRFTPLIAETVEGVPRLKVGDWVETAFDWVEETFEPLFDTFSDLITTTIDGLADVLTWPPALVMAAIFALIAFVARDIKLAIGSFLGMAFIVSMDQWVWAMDTLALVAVATLISLLIGVPVGILASRFEPVSRSVRPVMDLLQTMPAFVWLVPVVTLFSIDVPAGLVATVIFAIPPGVRLTELGIRQVDAEVVEAGHSFGASPRQILREVQIPLAMPTIMAGVNQVIMLALSMAVIAGLVGAGGLGGQVTKSIAQLNLGLGFEAGLSVVVLAIYIDRVTAAAGDRGPGKGRIRTLVDRLGGDSGDDANSADVDSAVAA